jgi:hypothetical protein
MTNTNINAISFVSDYEVVFLGHNDDGSEINTYTTDINTTPEDKAPIYITRQIQADWYFDEGDYLLVPIDTAFYTDRVLAIGMLAGIETNVVFVELLELTSLLFGQELFYSGDIIYAASNKYEDIIGLEYSELLVYLLYLYGEEVFNANN